MLNKSSFIISLSLSLLKTCIDTTWLWAWRLEDYSCVIWGKERGGKKKKWNPLHSWFQFISFWHVWAVILCCQRLEMECTESKLYYIIQWLDIILCWGYKWNPWVSFSFRFSYDSICDNESFLNGKKMECSEHEMSSKDFLVFKNWFRQCYSVMWYSCFKFLLLFSCKSNFYTIFDFF